MNIYLDIETVPHGENWLNDYVAKTIKPPAQMKKAETIAKWELESKTDAIQEKVESLAFDGVGAKIVCICAAKDDSNVNAFYGGEEKEILRNFMQWLEDVTMTKGHKVIGHNVHGFDLKIIRQRCLLLGVGINQVLLNAANSKPWDSYVFDTMLQWDSKGYTKMDLLAMAFGLEGKSGSGADVLPLYREGKLADIAKYCANDVELTRQLAKKMGV